MILEDKGELSLSIDIDMECLKKVMDFCNPESLQAMSHTCKELRKYLNTEMVVRSCMLTGGYTLDFMNIVQKGCKSASIYPMSPSALLAAALARECSLCGAGIHHMRKDLLIPICYSCVKTSGTIEGISSEEPCFVLNPLVGMSVVHHKRVDKQWYGVRNARSLWAWQMALAERFNIVNYATDADRNSQDDLRDVAFIEGRRMQVLKIKDKVAYLNRKNWVDGSGNKFGKIFTASMLRSVIVQFNGFSSRDLGEILSYVDFVMQSVALLAGAPYKEDDFYLEFIDIFNAYKDEAELRVENRIAEKAMSSDRYITGRVQTCERLVLKMKKYMNEPGLAYLLSYRINRNYPNEWLRRNYNQHPLKFSVLWVDEFMREKEIMKKPSKLSIEEIEKFVGEMKELSMVKVSPRDKARLRYNHKTLLKYFYKQSEGSDIYRNHGV